MVFKLFGRNYQHNRTRQWVGVQNHQNQRNSHPIPNGITITLPSPTCTCTEKESRLHCHASRRRVQKDSQWVIMDDQPREYENRDGYKYDNLYRLMAINPKGAMKHIAESQDSNLWHNRLGNMSQDGIDRLTAIDYIPKLQTKTNFCEHCRYGKQTRSLHSLHYKVVH